MTPNINVCNHGPWKMHMSWWPLKSSNVDITTHSRGLSLIIGILIFLYQKIWLIHDGQPSITWFILQYVVVSGGFVYWLTIFRLWTLIIVWSTVFIYFLIVNYNNVFKCLLHNHVTIIFTIKIIVVTTIIVNVGP